MFIICKIYVFITKASRRLRLEGLYTVEAIAKLIYRGLGGASELVAFEQGMPELGRGMGTRRWCGVQMSCFQGVFFKTKNNINISFERMGLKLPGMFTMRAPGSFLRQEDYCWRANGCL